jgi:hypothetical protein
MSHSTVVRGRNHVLASAVELFFAAGQPSALFDEGILAAGDEVATTLESPDHSGMFRVRDIALRISVYASKRDIAIAASMLVNHNARLGFDGPAGKTNPVLYPEQTTRSVDCTEVFDLLGPDFDPIASHQYYRRSKTVRADMTMLMAAGPVAPGISALRAFVPRISRPSQSVHRVISSYADAQPAAALAAVVGMARLSCLCAPELCLCRPELAQPPLSRQDLTPATIRADPHQAAASRAGGRMVR